MARSLEEIVDEANELYMDGELEEAESLLTEARPLAEERGDLKAQASICNTLAGVRRSQDRMDEALELAQQTLELTEKMPSPDVHLGHMYDNVAQILNHLDRGGEALPYYRKAVELMKGEEEPDVASISRSLVAQSDIHLSLGNNDGAEQCLVEALETLRSVSAANHYFFDELAEVALQYTDLLLDSGKDSEALTVLTALAAQQEELFRQPDNKFAVLQGQGEAAHEMIKQEYREKGTVPFNWLQILVQLKRAQNRVHPSDSAADAIPDVSDFESRIYTHAPHELGPRHERTGVLLHLLAQETRQPVYFAAAEKHYQRALDLAAKAFGPGHPALEQVVANLRELYEDTGRDPAEVQAGR